MAKVHTAIISFVEAYASPDRPNAYLIPHLVTAPREKHEVSFVSLNDLGSEIMRLAGAYAAIKGHGCAVDVTVPRGARKPANFDAFTKQFETLNLTIKKAA